MHLSRHPVPYVWRLLFFFFFFMRLYTTPHFSLLLSRNTLLVLSLVRILLCSNLDSSLLHVSRTAALRYYWQRLSNAPTLWRSFFRQALTRRPGIMWDLTHHKHALNTLNPYELVSLRSGVTSVIVSTWLVTDMMFSRVFFFNIPVVTSFFSFWRLVVSFCCVQPPEFSVPLCPFLASPFAAYSFLCGTERQNGTALALPLAFESKWGERK